MKPIYENITLNVPGESLKIFTIEDDYFKSFWHFHPQLELTNIIEGEGMRYVGDSIEVFGPGDLVLLGKNIPHNWESFDHTPSKARALVIQFPEDIFLHFSEFRELKELSIRARKGLHYQNADPEIFKILNKLPEWDRSFQLIKFFEVLHTLNFQKSRKLSSTGFDLQGINNRETRINNVRKYMTAHISSPLSLEEMASYMKMTESYFCRWFKKNTGNTFTQYINKIRIEMICRELIVTDKSISEIAYSKGFENISHFNRVFKSFKEISPRLYRQRNKD